LKGLKEGAKALELSQGELISMKRIGWILFLALIVYFIFLIRQDIIDYRQLKKEKENVLKRVAEEKEMVKNLQVRLEKLEKGELVEELARTRLGMIKKGETAYKVIRDRR
jgi:cell division protein FtsB